jgi:predicted hydrolase (HD superfamily)
MGICEYRTIMERPESVALLRQYVHGDGLIKHCLATGAIMKAAAGFFSEDPVRWEEIGIPDDTCEVIQRHNHFLYSGTYDQPVEIALQAADSASGLIIACALVKGGHLSEVLVKTITKKAKEKSFAAGCDRNRIALITPRMEIPVFYECALKGMMEIRTELGLL